MTVRILNCDVMDGLRQLADESVHCVVTSPPYWGLRDYGVDGQIGLEPTPAEFIARMVEVFREVRRVLRRDGTCWVNMGDSYCSTDKWGGGVCGNTGKQTVAADGSVPSWTVRARKAPIQGIKPKDLMGMPWRLAFALQDDGWWLRSGIIWSKPNPMPESVRDRPTKAHEDVFLLVKSGRTTIWRAEDTGEWSSSPDLSERIAAPTDDDQSATDARWRGFDYFYEADAVREPASYLQPNSPESIASPYGQGFTRRAKGNAKTFRGGVYTGGKSRDNDGVMERDSHGNKPSDTLSRNRRSVWTIATAPFPEAHFATFPPELPEICIKAGCPKGGTVLDPFGGAGTTGLVADRLQRDAVLIELNPEYAAMARRRIDGDRGALLDVMEAAQ
jgi:DNA modification methylase